MSQTAAGDGLVGTLAATATGSRIEPDQVGNPCLNLPVDAWRATLEAAADAGAWLDWLGATGMPDGGCDVVAWLCSDDEGVLVRCRLDPQQELVSVADLHPAAAWHEREAAEMIGVHFTDGDSRPLLLRPPGSPDVSEDHAAPLHPLRPEVPLTARLARPWPGGEGPRARIPGVDRRWRT